MNINPCTEEDEGTINGTIAQWLWGGASLRIHRYKNALKRFGENGMYKIKKYT